MSDVKMVSYWDLVGEFAVGDCGFTIVYGTYNHKNSEKKPRKEMGVHWGDYPTSRGKLTPCVINKKVRNAILTGLWLQAMNDSDCQEVKNIKKAIDYFNDE